MPTLVIVPTVGELDEVVKGVAELGHPIEPEPDVRLPRFRVRSLDLVLSLGGLGKAQFAVQTQYLLDSGSWRLAVCAGAGGALVEHVAVGDVVVATETVEHDIRKVNRALVPRFPGDEACLARCRAFNSHRGDFGVHFGGIASGDEDVVDSDRRAACREATGALAVAWEGAGGARACAFSGVPFAEVRGITDRCSPSGPQDFKLNLPQAMQNVSRVLAFISAGGVLDQEAATRAPASTACNRRSGGPPCRPRRAR